MPVPSARGQQGLCPGMAGTLLLSLIPSLGLSPSHLTPILRCLACFSSQGQRPWEFCNVQGTSRALCEKSGRAFLYPCGNLSCAQPGGGKGWLIFLLPPSPLPPDRHFSGSTDGSSVHAVPRCEVRPPPLKKPAATCSVGDRRNGAPGREMGVAAGGGRLQGSSLQAAASPTPLPTRTDGPS